MEPKVLKLAPSGIPIGWLSLDEAAPKMFKEQTRDSILWTLGDGAFRMRGGFNSITGKRSIIEVPAIMAVSDAGHKGNNANYVGFNRNVCKYREGLRCGYCGNSFSRGSLTIDHIFPDSRGGLLTMENTISACYKCNNRKSNRTPEEANMPLLMKPFVPTMAEVMFMVRMGNVLDVQHEYLEAQFKNVEYRDYFKKVA